MRAFLSHTDHRVLKETGVSGMVSIDSNEVWKQPKQRVCFLTLKTTRESNRGDKCGISKCSKMCIRLSSIFALLYNIVVISSAHPFLIALFSFMIVLSQHDAAFARLYSSDTYTNGIKCYVIDEVVFYI